MNYPTLLQPGHFETDAHVLAFNNWRAFRDVFIARLEEAGFEDLIGPCSEAIEQGFDLIRINPHSIRTPEELGEWVRDWVGPALRGIQPSTLSPTANCNQGNLLDDSSGIASA